VAFVQHDLEENEEVEVRAGEVNSVQHISEIISLDSAPLKCDLPSKRGSARRASQ
jgi:hypothetical protein